MSISRRASLRFSCMRHPYTCSENNTPPSKSKNLEYSWIDCPRSFCCQYHSLDIGKLERTYRGIGDVPQIDDYVAFYLTNYQNRRFELFSTCSLGCLSGSRDASWPLASDQRCSNLRNQEVK